MKGLLLLCCLAGAVLCKPAPKLPEERVSFRGHKLVSVTVATPLEAEFLRELQSDEDLELDFWKAPARGDVHIHVAPTKEKKFVKTLERAGLTYKILHSDIEELIEHERDALLKTAGQRDISLSYQSLSQIETFLSDLAAAYPTRIRLSSIGKTADETDIWSVKISTDLDANNKKAIWVETGTHAREWITIAVALNTIDSMTKLYGSTGELASQVTAMLDLYDWYFVPVHNPDGYEYSININRLWRKNRVSNPQSPCYGVDLNRNWDANWSGAGASSSKCSDTYFGASALSEKETSALDSAVQATQANQEVVAFLSIHSYSQLLLVPYGYTQTKPSDYNVLKSIADDAMESLTAVHGTQFQVGTPPDLLYVASGGAYDHMKITRGIKYSYTYELRDTGFYGFNLPASQIQPSFEETFASLWRFAVRINEDDTSAGK